MKISQNKKGFTLIELMIVVVILWILMATVLPKLSWTGGSDDVERKTDLQNMQSHINDFWRKYWEFPCSTSKWRKYPSADCSVSWFDGLVSCLVAKWTIEEWSEDFVITEDPKEWIESDDWVTYQYHYWASANCQHYKLCAFAWKQDNELYLWINWEEATEWSRYICLTGGKNTKQEDITNLAE